MDKKIIILGFAGISFLLSSCGSEQESANNIQELSDNEIAQELDETEEVSAQKMFYALPSPFEVASLLKASGIEFEDDMLNSVDNVSKYENTTSKALNLGVYGADVSFTSIYDKTQHTMLYLSSIKKLADDLGISAAFDGETMTRLESSRDSRDSLQIIVAQAYGMANAYLKENSRSSSSSLILAGGWIEGVHIATSMLDPNEPNEDLIELIADQRFSLQNLISLLEINAEEEEIASLISELKELDTIYAEVNDEESNAVTASESENGTMILGGGSSIDVSSEVLVKITSKVNQIRSKIIG